MTTLPPGDQAFLDEGGFSYRVEPDGGFVCVIIDQFPLAAGLDPAASDLLIRLPAGYPDANPDMFWFSDPVVRVDGATIPQVGSTHQHRGALFHRWSRHVGQHWRPGIDDLRSYVAYIRKCIATAAK